MNQAAGQGAVIASAHHPIAVRIRKILRRPQLARRVGLFLLDGIHLMEAALGSSYVPEVILVSPRLKRTTAGRQLLDGTAQKGWPVLETTDSLMERLAPTDTPQGILGLFIRPSGPPAANLPRRDPNPGAPAWGTPPLALLLAGIQDPGNLGTLARTAGAFGFRSLITSADTVDPFHVRATRASCGALLELEIAAAVPLEEIRDWSASEGVLLLGLVPSGGKPIESLSDLLAGREGPIALVLGSEGRGIPPLIEGICAERGTIAMSAGAESLGVAASGTIALYLAARGAITGLAPAQGQPQAER